MGNLYRETRRDREGGAGEGRGVLPPPPPPPPPPPTTTTTTLDAIVTPSYYSITHAHPDRMYQCSWLRGGGGGIYQFLRNQSQKSKARSYFPTNNEALIPRVSIFKESPVRSAKARQCFPQILKKSAKPGRVCHQN